jgi:hypothetical protein
MLKKIQNFFKNKEQVLDTANIILGLLMLTALVVFWKTGNKLSMFAIIFSGGSMNICNGFRYLQKKNRRPMGHSMILFGVVILVLGMVILMI